MAWTLLDHLFPWRGGRFRRFLAGPGDAHAYMAHVGVGGRWRALPWLRRNIEHACSDMDPLLRWLAVDGYGFHEGYFHWPRVVTRQLIPAGLHGYAPPSFRPGAREGIVVHRRRGCPAHPGAGCSVSGRTPFGPFRRTGLGVRLCRRDGRRRIAALMDRRGNQPAGICARCGLRRQSPPACRQPGTAYRTGLPCGMATGRRRHRRGDGPGPGGSWIRRATEPAYEVWRRRVQQEFTRKAKTGTLQEVQHERS